MSTTEAPRILGTDSVPTPGESPERATAIVRHRSDEALWEHAERLLKARNAPALCLLMLNMGAAEGLCVAKRAA